MELRAVSLDSSTLIIEGTKQAIKRFCACLDRVRQSVDGYGKIVTAPVYPEDMTSIELCMTHPTPVMSTKSFPGTSVALPEVLEFPPMVRLGCFRCQVSRHACQRLSYALLPGDGEAKLSGYQVLPQRCHFCARPVAPESHCDYYFKAMTGADDGSREGPVMTLDRDEFNKTSRKVMRNDMARAEMRPLRVWRKGAAGVVMELTPESIGQLQQDFLAPLLVSGDTEDPHEHFSWVSGFSDADYDQIIFYLVDEIGKAEPYTPPQPFFHPQIGVFWAVCMNRRCHHRFLFADYACDEDRPPDYKGFKDLGTSDGFCPKCRSRYFTLDERRYVQDNASSGVGRWIVSAH